MPTLAQHKYSTHSYMQPLCNIFPQENNWNLMPSLAIIDSQVGSNLKNNNSKTYIQNHLGFVVILEICLQIKLSILTKLEGGCLIWLRKLALDI